MGKTSTAIIGVCIPAYLLYIIPIVISTVRITRVCLFSTVMASELA